MKNVFKNQKINCAKNSAQKIIFALLSLIIAATSFFISYFAKTTIVLPYSEQSNVDYCVYLKENSHYDSPSLEKDMQYIAALIDYVNVKFNYDIKFGDEINCIGKYCIKAHTKVFDRINTENVIYKNEETLLEKTISKKESSHFKINEDLKIKYSEYNDLVRNFKNSYNINADSSLTLIMYVELNGDYNKVEGPLELGNTMELTIPLSEQMINIKMDQKDVNNASELKEISSQGVLNYIFFAIGGVFALFFLICAVNLLVFMKTSGSKKSAYQKEKERLLREYDRIVVELKNMIKFQCGQIFIDVTTFSELLDASDKLGSPILHMEIEKNKTSWFVVKHESDLYRFILF